MTSKSNKKANLPRLSDRTKDFAKDWQRLQHSGRYVVVNPSRTLR